VTFRYTEGVAIDVQKSPRPPRCRDAIRQAGSGKKAGGTIETVGFLTGPGREIDYKTRVVKLALPEAAPSSSPGRPIRLKRLNEVKRATQSSFIPAEVDHQGSRRRVTHTVAEWRGHGILPCNPFFFHGHQTRPPEQYGGMILSLECLVASYYQ